MAACQRGWTLEAVGQGLLRFDRTGQTAHKKADENYTDDCYGCHHRTHPLAASPRSLFSYTVGAPQVVHMYNTGWDAGGDVSFAKNFAAALFSGVLCLPDVPCSGYSNRGSCNFLQHAVQRFGTVSADDVAICLHLGPLTVEMRDVDQLRRRTVLAQQAHELPCG